MCLCSGRVMSHERGHSVVLREMVRGKEMENAVVTAGMTEMIVMSVLMTSLKMGRKTRN